MKTKKYFFILFTILIGGFISCSNNDEEPTKSVEQQVKEVGANLATNQNLSTFTEAFNNLDANSIGTTDFTVFAFDNDAFEQGTKSTLSLSQEVLKRHIVKGTYTIEKLKQTNNLIALSGDTLNVEVVGNTVKINGIVLNTPSQINACVIFVVHSVIPTNNDPQPSRVINFRVLTCNDKWSVNDNNEGIPTPNANISIYKADKSLYQILKTDQNGEVQFSAKEGEVYYYNAEYLKDTTLLKDTYKGWKVVGLFTSASQIDSYAQYPSTVNKVLGGLKLADINADGVINDIDKQAYTLLLSTDTSGQISVFIASQSFKSQNLEQLLYNITTCINTKNSLEQSYLSIDNSYSTLQKRQTINSSDATLSNFWNQSYATIKEINRLIDIIPSSDPDLMNYKAILKSNKADLYFYLVTLFGAVPLSTTDTSSRSSVNEVYNTINSDLTEVIQFGSAGWSYCGKYVKGNVAMQNVSYNEAYLAFRELIDRGDISLTISKSTRGNLDFPIPAAPNPYALYISCAEAALNIGKHQEAITYTNQVSIALGLATTLPPAATREQILAQVQLAYSTRSGIDNKMKYMNISRWGLNLTWGKYTLLPIPQSAISKNPNLTQNPGW